MPRKEHGWDVQQIIFLEALQGIHSLAESTVHSSVLLFKKYCSWDILPSRERFLCDYDLLLDLQPCRRRHLW